MLSSSHVSWRRLVRNKVLSGGRQRVRRGKRWQELPQAAAAERLEDRVLLSHFRFGTISWEVDTTVNNNGRTVDFAIEQSWRRSAFGNAQVGQSFSVGAFQFGDGTSASLFVTVQSINIAEDLFVGRATLRHTYASVGNFEASFAGCCRISSLQNNSAGSFRTETIVNTGLPANDAPVSSLSPVVQVADNAIARFFVPAIDPNGDPLTFRLATPDDAGAGFSQPVALTINRTTGEVVWDIRDSVLPSVQTGQRWSAQVIIEDGKTKTPVDFILEIGQPAAVNAPPTISTSPGNSFAPVAGQTLNFTVTASDTDGTITQLEALNAPAGMTFSPFVSGPTVTRMVTWTPTQQQANQTFVVTFQARDSGGATKATSVTISPAANQAPIVDAGGPYTVNEGGSITLIATGLDPEGSPVTFEWDLDYDGTNFQTNATGATPSFSAASLDGTIARTVAVRVKDALGNATTRTAQVTIQNVAPSNVVISPSAPSVSEGDAIDFSASFTDPGTAETHVKHWHVFDPDGNQLVHHHGQTLNWTPTDDGIYSVRLDVHDGDGGVGTETATVTVDNVAPTATFSNVGDVDEGSAATVSFSSPSDPSTADTADGFHYSFALTTAGLATTYASAGAAPTSQFTFADNGAYTVHGRIFDKDGGFTDYETTFTVDNVAPALSNVELTPVIDENGVATFTGAINDAGSADSFELTVNWGDGTIETFSYIAGTNAFSETHRYLDDNPSFTASDTYTVSATLVDDDGGSGAVGSGFVTDVEPNDTFTNAQNIDGVGWNLDFNSDIGDATTNTSTVIPHVTVYGTGNDTVDVYAFTVATAGSRAVFDIDYGMFDFDPWLTLRSAAGTIIAENDDASTLSGQGGSVYHYDSYLEYTFTEAGTYYIEVGRYPSSQPIPNGDDYRLQVSLENHAIGSSATRQVTVNNVAPTPTILGAPANNPEGTAINLTSTVSDPGTLDTHTYEWSVVASNGQVIGDGTNPTFSFTPNDNGTYTVSLKVTDDDGGSKMTSQEVNVTNVAPVVDSANLTATTINENGSVTVSGNVSDVGTADTLTVTITWGEGPDTVLSGTDLSLVSAGLYSYTATHRYLDDNPPGTLSDPYTIGVKVADDEGDASAIVERTVTVNNVDPQIASLNPAVIDENGTATITGSFSDVGTLDGHKVMINWGDGTSSAATVNATTRTFTADHQYKDDNPTITASDIYAIGVTVTDDDGGTATGDTTVTVNNVDPQIVTLNPATIKENGTAVITGSFSDVGTLDGHTVMINWGDGTTSAATVDAAMRTFTADHQYKDDNPTITASDIYTVGVTVTDDDGGTATGGTTVTVNNVAPVVTAFADPANSGLAVPGLQIDFSGAFTDVGTLDTHTAIVNWGDDSSGTLIVGQGSGSGTLSASHVYKATGCYIVTVAVTDDDTGDSTEYTTTVTVQSAALLADPCGEGLALFVGGTTDADKIHIKPVDNSGAVAVTVNGASAGTFTPTSERIVIYAQNGNDDVQVAGSVHHAVWAYGGQGNDRIKGGAGADVLMGQTGEDLIVGGNGRDMLVGGGGSDRIVGNGDDDILIAGSLDFGGIRAAEEAICHIMQEWTSEHSYQERISNLTGASATGVNDGHYLIANETIVDDGAADRMTGSSGDDWSFFNDDDDRVTGMSELEEIYSSSDLDVILSS